MTAQDELKLVLREIVGPYLRSQGFKGSGSSWRKWNELDDCAVISVQSSKWNTSNEVSCIVNLGVVPRPWLDWEQTLFGNQPINPKTVHESHACWWDRLVSDLARDRDTHGRGGWWHVTDRESAISTADNIVARLDAIAIPTLDRLLIRNELIDALRAGKTGFSESDSGAGALAVMLSEDGQSNELDAALAQVVEEAVGPKAESTLAFIAWVRERASRA